MSLKTFLTLPSVQIIYSPAWYISVVPYCGFTQGLAVSLLLPCRGRQKFAHVCGLSRRLRKCQINIERKGSGTALTVVLLFSYSLCLPRDLIQPNRSSRSRTRFGRVQPCFIPCRKFCLLLFG